MVQIRSLRSIRPTIRISMPQREIRSRYRPKVTVVERRLVDFPAPTPQPTPCRLWQGAVGSDGYGWRKVVRADGTRAPMSMHRWVMSQLLERRLESWEVVLHACDQPLCYRIDHLSIGTVQSNNRDMLLKGRNSKPPVNVFHGEAHPMAKLSRFQVDQIRNHWISGLSARTIADMYDISPTTVRRIVKGITWATGKGALDLTKPSASIAERSKRTMTVKRGTP